MSERSVVFFLPFVLLKTYCSLQHCLAVFLPISSPARRLLCFSLVVYYYLSSAVSSLRLSFLSDFHEGEILVVSPFGGCVEFRAGDGDGLFASNFVEDYRKRRKSEPEEPRRRKRRRLSDFDYRKGKGERAEEEKGRPFTTSLGKKTQRRRLSSDDTEDEAAAGRASGLPCLLLAASLLSRCSLSRFPSVCCLFVLSADETVQFSSTVVPGGKRERLSRKAASPPVGKDK